MSLAEELLADLEEAEDEEELLEAEEAEAEANGRTNRGKSVDDSAAAGHGFGGIPMDIDKSSTKS